MSETLVTAETKRRLRKWLSRYWDRSVRIDYYGDSPRYRWGVVGWLRCQRRVEVSVENGRTLEAAMKRFLAAAEKQDAGGKP